MDVVGLERVYLILIEEDDLLVACLERGQDPRLSQLLSWDQGRIETLFEAIEKGRGQSDSSAEFGSNGVIFAVCSTWVDDQGALLEGKKNQLRQVCQKFSIKPLGFLTDIEVFSRYFEDFTDGDNSNSFISVFAGKDFFSISLVHLGKIKGRSVYRGRQLNSAAALAEAVESFDFSGVLPPWLLVWGTVPEGLESDLLAYPWTEKKTFLHLPEITVFDFIEACHRFSKVIFAQSDEAVGLGEQSSLGVIPESDFGFGPEDQAQKTSKSEEMFEELTAEEFIPAEESLAPMQPSLEQGVEDFEPPKAKKSFSNKFQSLGEQLKRLSFKARLRGKTWIYGLVLIPVLVLLAGLGFWYFGKAKIEIYLSPQEIQETLSAQLNPEAKEFDLDKGIIPVEIIELVLEGSEEAVSTGEKLVGERAEGSVKIYNRTNKSQSFKEGTVLTGPGGFKFSLLNDVTVASKSADLLGGVDKWGEVSVNVSAAQIGAEYNLASESVFSVADFSQDSFLAKNGNSFSGGTSRKIRAVSQQDQDELKTKLEEEFLATANDKFLSRQSELGKVFPESTKLEIVEEKYTGQVGEEREDLSLFLKVKASAYWISNQSLEDLANDLLTKKLEEGLVVAPGSLKTELKVDKQKEKILTGQLTVSGRAYPRLDSDGILEKVKGKTKTETGNIIRSYQRVYRYQISFSPSWIGMFSRLPSRVENISIEMKDQNGSL
ncbi:MAG: hypothetical protein ABID04_03985 [Patescibacteria group bacterium]